MPTPEFDKQWQVWIAAIPTAIMAALGWIGFHLSKDDPKLNTAKFVGGVVLSSFTGGAICILLQETGIHPNVASVVAAAVGSSGIKGYEWLVSRAENASLKK